MKDTDLKILWGTFFAKVLKFTKDIAIIYLPLSSSFKVHYFDPSYIYTGPPLQFYIFICKDLVSKC